jgi:hypothetical protein
MGVFYTIVMLAQTLGFGVDKQGTESFAGSSSPLGTFPGATWDLSWPTP